MYKGLLGDIFESRSLIPAGLLKCGEWVYYYCVCAWCWQLEKDTRSDTELEETGPEDESIVERKTLNNNSNANSEQNSHQVNAGRRNKKNL